MIRRGTGIWLTIGAQALVAQLFVTPFAVAAADGAIPWKRDLTITRTSSDDNIKNVLRMLLQSNDLSVIFGPKINNVVSFHLENVPIQTAFEQLIDEHHLTYSYNPSTKTVTINSAGGAVATPDQTVFIGLNSVSYEQVVQSVGNLGLGLGGLRYDAKSKTLAISGDQARTKQIEVLVQSLEATHKKAGAGSAGFGPEEVKVIPLRFTDVGPSTRQFQGKTVTVPGIADTLRTVLGLDSAPSTAASETAPSASYGRPRISIDQRTNSVVVQGSLDAIAAIEKIIRQLDRPLQMVEIEVIIVTADMGVAKQLGVDWRTSSASSGSTAGSLAVDTGTQGSRVTNGNGQLFSSNGLDALSLLPSGAAGATTASFVIRGGEAVLQAQIQALASQNKARILSAPRLVTLDNITARITRSQNIFVQVDTRNAQGGGSGGVGLQEIQTGLTLEITPSIVPAESNQDQSLVRLNLRAENSAPGSGSFGQIDVKSQEVQTNVLVPDSATFVIGGLFDDTSLNTERGVPGLKDIPFLGSLFRTTQNQQSLGETIFFITPRIVDERSVLQSDIAVREGSSDYIKRARAQLDVPGTMENTPRSGKKILTSSLEEDE